MKVTITVDLESVSEVHAAIGLLTMFEHTPSITNEVFEDVEVLEDVEVIEEPSQVDKHGRQWNPEIDSTPAVLTVKLEWRAKRKPKNLTDVEWITFVEERKNQSTDVIVSGAVDEPTGSVFDAPQSTGFENMLGGDKVEEPAATSTFVAFKAEVVKRAIDAELPEFTIPMVNERCVELGVASIAELEGRQDLIDILALELF